MKLIPKLLLGMGLVALPALCGPIVTNQWYAFGWNGSAPTFGTSLGAGSGYTGSSGTPIAALACAGTAPCTDPWTFSGAASLVVQDLYFDGDRFSIFDSGVLIGATSVPLNDGTACGNDPVGCVGNVKFSSGTFNFGAGSHSITMQVLQESNGFSSGQAVFELLAGGTTTTTTTTTGGVPEPTTLSMMGLGLGALIFGWRARRKA